MTAPTVRHRALSDKYATGVPKIKKIKGRENISVGTLNVRTLSPAGKLKQLTHAMSRYHWNIVEPCEMRLKNFSEMSTDDGHKIYFSGEEDSLVVQGNWNATVGKDAQADREEACGPFCNVETNERGLRLIEFANFNNLVLTNTLALKNNPEDGHGTAQMGNTTTRLITSW